MSRVLVTGATGFIGSALCAVLTAKGVTVVRALRRDGVEPLAGCEDIVVGEIGPDAVWKDALSGVDAVVHLAARVHVMNETAEDPASLYQGINTETTRILAATAAEAGVKRFIYLSSTKAQAEASGERALRETDPPAPVDAYGRSKLAAELALSAIAAKTAMNVVSLRPPLVYGAGVKGNFLRLLGLVDRGVPLPLDTASNRRSLVYLGNLVDAIVRVLEHPGPVNGAFFITDGAPSSTPQLIRDIAAALGKPARLFPVPSMLLRLAGRLTGKSDQVSRLLDSLEVDDSAFRKTFGWVPAFTMTEGLQVTAAWYLARKGDRG
ncbi:MAG: SDR family oxidoreductase [Rhodospirillales bacterium]|nr:SDR family oxidoreductase [Rhodospirillales bacterium]